MAARMSEGDFDRLCRTGIDTDDANQSRLVDEARRARESEAALLEALQDVARTGLGFDLFDPWLRDKLRAALAKAEGR